MSVQPPVTVTHSPAPVPVSVPHASAFISVSAHAIARWNERAGEFARNATDEIIAAFRNSRRLELNEVPWPTTPNAHYFRHLHSDAYFVAQPIDYKSYRIVTVLTDQAVWRRPMAVPKKKRTLAEERVARRPFMMDAATEHAWLTAELHGVMTELAGGKVTDRRAERLEEYEEWLREKMKESGKS